MIVGVGADQVDLLQVLEFGGPFDGLQLTADHQVQAFFSARYQGTPVRGMMIVNVNGGKGYTSVLFDREDLFNRSLPTLSSGMASARAAAAATIGSRAASTR